jgi:hypothetical protein
MPCNCALAEPIPGCCQPMKRLLVYAIKTLVSIFLKKKKKEKVKKKINKTSTILELLYFCDY